MDSQIDFKKIFLDLKKHKRLYFKVLSAAVIIAVVYSLSLHNFYNCTVKLSPELGKSVKSGGGLASIASSFGVNLGDMGSGADAITPALYPDLMNSTDFKTSLFDVPVTIEGDKESGEKDRTMTYYDYLDKEQRYPWWTSAIKGLIVLFKSDKPANKTIDPFRLTKEQSDIVKKIDKNVTCTVDKKTMVISISVTDQDPVICATMADTVKNRLQKFITDYRTNKVRVDLEYNRKICKETKARYEKARQKYVEFADANQDVILQTVRQKQTDLENEMQLQYNAYQQVAAQLLAAEAKVQEQTPAFTTLQSATVPVQKTGPKRAQICIVFLLLSLLLITIYILYKEDDLKSILDILGL